MFISERLVYLELHKTGCSHIRRALTEALDGKIVGKHNQATSDLFNVDSFFVGSIRNPWDWYLSLWGFGCDGHGILRNKLVGNSRSPRALGYRLSPVRAVIELLNPTNHNRAWKAAYRDANDPAAFRAWLHMLHDQAYMTDIGEGYSNSALRHAAGLMTFRYLKLFSTMAGEERRLNHLSTHSLIRAWGAQHTFVNSFIRNETLVADLFRIFEDYELSVKEEARSNILALPKTNTSSRKRKLDYYYDPDTVALVAEREQLIIKKFAYTAPEL